MLSLQGVGATTGKGSGIALIYKKTSNKLHEKYYHETAKELLSEIQNQSMAEIDSLISICKCEEEKDILIAHKLMLSDSEVIKSLEKEIDSGEDLLKAIKNVQGNYYNLFKAMDDEVFSSKALDVEEVFQRLIDNIKKQNKIKSINKSFILVCDDLLPTTIYDYPIEYLRGIVVKHGTFFSHGVIIAKSKNIPVVIGLGTDIDKINQGDYLVIDGLSGKVVLISEWWNHHSLFIVITLKRHINSIYLS